LTCSRVHARTITPERVHFVSASPQQQPLVAQDVQSFIGHIVFSVIVFFCFNPLFGLIALILAGCIRGLPLLVLFWLSVFLVNVHCVSKKFPPLNSL